MISLRGVAILLNSLTVYWFVKHRHVVFCCYSQSRQSKKFNGVNPCHVTCGRFHFDTSSPPHLSADPIHTQFPLTKKMYPLLILHHGGIICQNNGDCSRKLVGDFSGILIHVSNRDSIGGKDSGIKVDEFTLE